MDTNHCHCGKVCHLRDYARQPWIRSLDYNKQPWLRHDGEVTLKKLDVDRTPITGGVVSVFRSNRTKKWLQWIQSNVFIVLVILLLFLTILMPFVWILRIPPEEQGQDENTANKEPDAKLGRILRSLRAVQTENDVTERRHLLEINETTQKFPWLVQQNVLPNFFLTNKENLNLKDEFYERSAVVLLHNHHVTGSTVEGCIRNISQQKSLGNVLNWNSDNRATWERNTKFKTKTGLENIKFQTGQYSFGMCDKYKSQQCSYTLMLREPMERAMSSYYHCKEFGLRGPDEMCNIINANDITLRDWILLTGSLTFQQLLFNSTWCEEQTPLPGDYSLGGTDVHIAPSREWPCWLKQRLHMERLSVEDGRHLMDYILQNLDKWFTVIGLVGEEQEFLTMLEKIYTLPFSQCGSKSPAKIQKNKGYHDNVSNQNKHRHGYYEDNDPEYLKYDYQVRQALEADVQIYKRAQQIYNIQKQMVFNSL